MILQIGDYTTHGTVVAIMWIGERYYSMRTDDGAISLVPGVLAEREHVLDPVKCVRITCA